MRTLVLHLAGPMQSWGTQSRFTERDTGLEPSKSGVIGLLGAAVGLPRDADATDHAGVHIALAALAALTMAVRVEREGTVERDYQTAGGWNRRADAGYGVVKADGSKPSKLLSNSTVVSNRYYLADAAFLVGLSGTEADEALLTALADALAAPRWPLALGRKAFVPTVPPHLPAPDGATLWEGDAKTVLCERVPWQAKARRYETPPEQLRLVVETTAVEGARRQDVPVSFAIAERAYRVRYVETKTVNRKTLPVVPVKEGNRVSLAPAP